MDVGSILIVLPLLIIFSYLFDIFARKTKFPSVILLVLTGIILRFFSSYSGYSNFEFLDSLVPVLGTIGLILIVLEAALELEIKKEKTQIIIKGFLAALVILMINIVLVSIFFNKVIGLEYATSVIYAIPLSIISSAVAIPSATGLITKNKEFVVYESTFSDILGIMIFYYCIRQAEKGEPFIGLEPIFTLIGQIFLIIGISIAITYLLFQLIQRIEHHVKFFLILALLILAYEIGKDFLKIKDKFYTVESLENKKLPLLLFSFVAVVFSYIVGNLAYYIALNKNDGPTMLVPLIAYVFPLIVMTLISLFVKQDKVNRKMLIGIIITIAGISYTLYNKK